MPDRRQRAAVAVLATVIAAHGLLLGAWPGEPAPGPGRGVDRVGRLLHVRAVVRAAPPPAAVTPPAAPARVKAARRTAAPSTAPAPAAAPALAAPPPESPEAADPGGLTLPLYPARLPAAATLHYVLQRGAAVGSARLDWQPGSERYALVLQSQLAGRPALAWASAGVIGSQGVAPERYVESRRGREQRAANFERASGRIRFSGPQGELPLPAGAQDRVSWLLQLAGVLAADPALTAPGQTVTLYVAGARGDGRAWIFRVLGTEDLDLPAGAVRALRLRREPERPYDTLAEVWLDPGRGHLPVRVRWQAPPAPEATELNLQAPGPP